MTLRISVRELWMKRHSNWPCNDWNAITHASAQRHDQPGHAQQYRFVLEPVITDDAADQNRDGQQELDRIDHARSLICFRVHLAFINVSDNVPSEVAGQEGIEPPTCGFGDPPLCQLSYWPVARRDFKRGTPRAARHIDVN